MNTQTLERPPLTQIIGTVIHKTSAPAGNKPGKLRLDDGKILYAFADKLQMVEIGGSYDFGVASNETGGVIYLNVKAIRPARQAFHQPASRPQEPQQQRSAPVQQPKHPAPPGALPASPIEYNRATHPQDGQRMFVCSILNAFIQTGRIENDVAALTDAVNKLRDVWANTFGLDGDGE